MKHLILAATFLLVSTSFVLAAEMEAGTGDLLVPAGICQGTTGEEVKKTFYPNGSLDVKANCKDGKINGIVKKYTAAGKIRMKVEYVNDKLEGVAKLHDENGNIIYHDEYQGGVRKTHQMYNSKGELVPAS